MIIRIIYFVSILFWGILPELFAETSPIVSENDFKLYCKKLNEKFDLYKWDKFNCETLNWQSFRKSISGDPLTWITFGDVSEEGTENFKKKEITLIMCGVHGDEITPVKFCFDIIQYFKELNESKAPELIAELKDKILIVAPLVNPDSFFKKKPTRVNARGVDINRNFPTNDWNLNARKIWIQSFKKDKRRNPGLVSNSEPEVVFQINLIKRFNPKSIISVHSPLTLIDYDGPENLQMGPNGPIQTNELLKQISKDAAGYRIENYPFFPGSLGNWAGKERSIPTYTLELPSSDPSKSSLYWGQFKSAIHNAVLQTKSLSKN